MAPPPFGTAADVVSLGRSLWKGDWGGALLDVVGIIPLVGDGIKGVSKSTQIAAKMKQVDIAIKAAKVRLVRTKMGLSVSDIKKTQASTTDAAKNCAVQRCPKKGSGVIKNTSIDNPVFEISKKKYPNHAKVIENAEKKGHSTKNLERGAGTKEAQRNRRRAQAEIRKKKAPPPEGYDYDEFPCASSKQGGKGAHIEPIKSEENQAAGRDLGQFYKEHRINKGDKYDGCALNMMYIFKPSIQAHLIPSMDTHTD